MPSEFMKKIIWQAAREFILSATEYCYTPSKANFAKVQARYLQLLLTEVPSRTVQSADSILQILVEDFQDREQPSFLRIEPHFITFCSRIVGQIGDEP